MNFYTYIGKSKTDFEREYLGVAHGQYASTYTRLVNKVEHMEFPLDLYTYSRTAIHEQHWDGVVSKCRGVIVNRDTGDVVARPFEKFHNYGSDLDFQTETYDDIGDLQPVVWEKLDGFLCTLYTWKGVDYIASKGSFHSVRAKWATAWIRKKYGQTMGVPPGLTPVFEGLCRDLGIVVDYKDRQGLVLLSVINNETGEEPEPIALVNAGMAYNIDTPRRFDMTLKDAATQTIQDPTGELEEGYVLTWYRDGKPPFRLKMKFIEYLKLHRMVTDVSPKRVWEVLATNQSSELNEWLQSSPSWFAAFAKKWVTALRAEYDRIAGESHTRFECAEIMLGTHFDSSSVRRKAYALEFNKPGNKEYASVLFALLDKEDVAPVIWKKVKKMTEGVGPMIDAHNT